MLRSQLHQNGQTLASQTLTFMSGLLILGVLSAVWPNSANAQINPFRGNSSATLTKQDIEAGKAAAGKLLNDDQAEVGKSEEWVSPTSGNQGTITVLRSFKGQGMDCRALQSEIRYHKSSTSPRKYELNLCRVKNGEWKAV